MASVNISAQFPKDDRHLNGLERILAQLINAPLGEHLIIARVTRSRLTVNDVAGTATPSVRLVHVEAVMDPGRRDDALKLLEAEYAERTGRKDLPKNDLFNPGPGEHDGQSTVGQQLAESADRDPEAGPWPGDSDYEPPEGR